MAAVPKMQEGELHGAGGRGAWLPPTNQRQSIRLTRPAESFHGGES